MIKLKPLLAIAAQIATVPLASAQSGEGEPGAPQQDIVVTALRSGAPMWVVERGGTRIVLVGEIAEVPKSTPWRPERLEGATERADRVVLGLKAKVSPGDFFRLLFKGGKLRSLPEGKTVADFLDPVRQARLARLMGPDDDYQRRNLLLIAYDLLTKRLRFNRDTGKEASDIVQGAARKKDIPTRPVGTVRGKDLLDSLFTASPRSHLACLDAAMDAAERGAGIVEQRGLDWTRYDVPAVMKSPIEQAVDRCWPWGDQRFSAELRNQWNSAVDEATGQQGATLVVVPLRILAEKGGILDHLRDRGLEPKGPRWRE